MYNHKDFIGKIFFLDLSFSSLREFYFKNVTFVTHLYPNPMEMRSNFPGHVIRQKLQFTPVVCLCGLCEKRKSFRVHLHVCFVRFLPLLQKFAWMLASLMSNNCIILHTSKLHNLFPLIILELMNTSLSFLFA